MTKHADDEEVLVGYSSFRNISMTGKNEGLGITWGEWREMTEKDRHDVMMEYLHELVEVYVEDDEEGVDW